MAMLSFSNINWKNFLNNTYKIFIQKMSLNAAFHMSRDQVWCTYSDSVGMNYVYYDIFNTLFMYSK